MATLNGYVHVTDETGAAHVFGPADDVPAWAQELITNPKAWAEAPTVSRLTDLPPVKATPAKRTTARRKAASGEPVQSG